MATWLACDELDFHGAFAVASGWLGCARRLLGELEPGVEHGWLAFFEGYLASAAGDSDRAIGRRLEVPDLGMLGLALEGATMVAGAQVDEGMRRLERGDRGGARGRGRRRDRGGMGLLLLGHGVLGSTRLRARVAVV